MFLRTKLTIFSTVFILLTSLLVAGSFLIFNRMTSNFASQRSVIAEHNYFEQWRASIIDFIMTAEGWGNTGNAKFKKEYKGKLMEVREAFSQMRKLIPQRETAEAIEKKFREITIVANSVIATEYPVGDINILKSLRRLEEIEGEIHRTIEVLHSSSIHKLGTAIDLGEKIERHMAFYLGALFFIISSSFLFLSFSLRRMITSPFNDLLKATEKISPADLTYRIGSPRTDEFGIISNRFDKMVEKLGISSDKTRSKLAETELLLETAKIAGTKPEIKEALKLICETVALKLEKDACYIYMFSQERNAFCLEAGNITDESDAGKCLPLNHLITEAIINKLDHMLIEDIQGHLPEKDLAAFEKFGSLLTIPIIRNSHCTGFLMVATYRAYGFSEDETDTLKILAHTISSVVMNAELYVATRNQLQQLTVVYELAKAIASVLDLNELLGKITKEISRLLNVKACLLRLLEGDELKIRSSYGLDEELARKMTLSRGEGVAGWVAKEGKPMFIVDLSNMPAELRIPHVEAKSVICVPLKADGNIIGTLGIYDKMKPDGEFMPFNIDDLSTLEGFASISSVAIQKASLYEHELMIEKETAEAKKRLDVLFDTVQGGIITVDKNYRVISVNRFVENMVNKQASEIIGMDSMEIFHDKEGICPHCVSKATFETGEVNIITQSKGLNYAELTAYPLKDAYGNVSESVIFIQDITDKVIYQEEILNLYKEVAQTKEYLESLINNSADAIVTSDLNGIITSWNKSAERIFGFREDEVMGKFLPFVPHFLLNIEKDNIVKIKNGELIRDVEISRQRKDGAIIEVSLTLSPIKDALGEIIGISGISRDITDKKKIENELIRRNKELSRLFFISSAMRGTLELDRLLRMVLTAVTMSEGLGFNRAILFLVDEDKNILKGAMGVGPSSTEEAWQVWERLSMEKATLSDVISDIEVGPLRKDSFLDRLSIGIGISLEENSVLTRSVREKKPFNIQNAKEEDSLYDNILIQQLGTEAYAVVPLISRGKAIGLLWVDNLFTRKPVTDEDMKFLTGFSNQIAAAIESARLFEQVSLAEAELENIFKSISDMVYFTDRDFQVKTINKAVMEKLGRSEDEIIGRKCYQVFHNMDEPLKTCPHHKTVEEKKAFMEEYTDPYLGGTFLASSSPIYDTKGDFIGTVHISRDISELKNLREKLSSSERMAALGEMAAKVAHEIRNPLLSIGGFARRLEKKLDGNLKDYSQIIVDEVVRLESILKDILGFVKESRMSKKPVNLNEVLDNVINLVSPEVLEKKNVIVKRLSEAPINISIDPDRIKEAVLNIIANANQATSEGTIEVSARQTGEYAIIEITDTGTGIKPEDLKYIFDPFFTTRITGTGLGLSITNRIIEEHKGRIEVESPAGQGTRFSIFLPLN